MKDKINFKNPPNPDISETNNVVVSATESTGLYMTCPDNEGEEKSIQEIRDTAKQESKNF